MSRISDDPVMVERAAALYRVTAAQGMWPTQAVAGALGVSGPTAARLVRAARDQGLLPASQPGRITYTTAEHQPRRARWSKGTGSWLACRACRQPWPCPHANDS